jgi:uncharacterized membrane protein (DUF373 family)
MIRLVYISSAKHPFTTEKLIDLLSECREQNAQKAITGVLFYHNQTFLQVLEGDETEIDKLVKIIKKDPRHSNFTVIEKVEITERQFSQWSMGFKDISEAEFDKIGITGFESFFNREGSGDNLAASSKKVVESLMQHVKKVHDTQHSHQELPVEHEDKWIGSLHFCIHIAVKLLAALMVVVIYMSVADVAFVIYDEWVHSPVPLLNTHSLLTVFSAFLVVLIAIEIFINITLYIRNDVIPIKLVIATALMAIARKVIVFDFKVLSPAYIWAAAAVVLALGITYWLLNKTSDEHS